jgi:hypothetical protein
MSDVPRKGNTREGEPFDPDYSPAATTNRGTAVRVVTSPQPGCTVQPRAKGDPLEITKVTAVPAVGISKQRTKAAATPQAPAEKSGTKGETQESTPMVTRSRKKASRAGGLRGVDGLGQTETGVLQMATPSKT